MKSVNSFNDVLESIYNYFQKEGRIARSLIRIVLALIITVLSVNLKLYRMEAFLYDSRMVLKGEESVDDRIQLITINEEDKEIVQDLQLSSMNAHLKVLKRMLAEKPAAIAYLNRFRPSEIQQDWQTSERFLDLAQKAQEQGTQIIFGTQIDLMGEILPPYPLNILPHYPAIIHKDGKMFSEDKITRRALLTVPHEPSLHLKLANLDLPNRAIKEKLSSINGAYFYKAADAWHTLIRYPGNTNVDNKLFPEFSFSSLLGTTEQKLNLKDKIVLIGNVREEILSDYSTTPFSKEADTNPQLYIHASILNTLLADNGIVYAHSVFDVIITFLLSLLLIYFALRFSPAQGVLCLLITSSCLFIISLGLFKFGSIALNLIHPLFAIFCTYYLVVPYRAIMEYKKRWKVQEKHDLLLQIEEMKGNFLSLMSHDLKTPVARIQGLAELVLKQGGLSAQQEMEMHQIVHSTESLNKFISKILDLTRVESSQIKLNTKSKDINKIITKCVEKLEFQAKRKDISIDKKLEPLFPIQIDSPLIIQVLTNLLDNAIQYSQDGTSIEVFSREVDDNIEVVIRDHGRGMDEQEKNHLFQKFYRGKNPAGDQIKGSGLGLYLSKYFIELHDGKISVESEKGIGSQFTISLPIN